MTVLTVHFCLPYTISSSAICLWYFSLELGLKYGYKDDCIDRFFDSASFYHCNIHSMQHFSIAILFCEVYAEGKEAGSMQTLLLPFLAHSIADSTANLDTASCTPLYWFYIHSTAVLYTTCFWVKELNFSLTQWTNLSTIPRCTKILKVVRPTSIGQLLWFAFLNFVKSTPLIVGFSDQHPVYSSPHRIRSVEQL